MEQSTLAVLLVSERAGGAALVRSAFRATGTDPARVLTWVRDPGEAAVELAARDFDCVLVDLVAHDLSPLDAITALDGGVPVIVLVEPCCPDLSREALRRGAHDHLTRSRLDGRLLLRSARYAGESRRSRAEPRRTDHLWSSVVGALPEGVLVLSASGRIQTANASALAILGLPLDEVAGATSGDPRWRAVREDGAAFPPAELPGPVSLRTGEAVTGTVLGITRPHGAVAWLEANATPLVREAGERPYGVVISFRDITARRATENRLQAGFEHTAVGIMMVDADCRMAMVNPAVRTLLRRPDGELLGHRIDEFLHRDDRGPALGRFAALVRGEVESYQAERRYLRPDGSTVWVQANLSRLRDDSGRSEYFFAQLQDITDRRAMEDALEHLAVHDALTQLPNRTLLTDRLQHALNRRDLRTAELAVLFVDIDRFKFVNDGMGHRAGDELLAVVARRLRETVRPSDTVARFGGDEFVVVCEQLSDPWEASSVAARVARVIEEPMVLDGREVVVTASVGVAVAAADATVDSLLRDADAAMYRAKDRGRARVEVFDERLRGRASERLELEVALRRALAAGELELAYQPIVRVDTETVIGCEALLRWRHPRRGLVSPAEFIPLAEETGLIVPIGAWVLTDALRQGRAWHAEGRELAIGVNLSARQLMAPDLVDTVREALVESGIDPQKVHLEITESVLMDDVEQSIETLTALKELGIHFAVDDFGTGYSSLSYLQRLPIDTLKIDQSFVRGLGVAENDSSIVRAIAGLGRALGMGLLAEGVENPRQLEELQALGCDAAQGFLWSPGVPAAEFPTSVARN
jgi:diguanylate cyclase (GGDEF)-like protein/PAS domain S-box-containing protein